MILERKIFLVPHAFSKVHLCLCLHQPKTSLFELSEAVSGLYKRNTFLNESPVISKSKYYFQNKSFTFTHLHAMSFDLHPDCPILLKLQNFTYHRKRNKSFLSYYLYRGLISANVKHLSF